MTKPAGEPRQVLLLSPFFFPESISTGRYNTHLVRALSDAGCEVEVLTSHPLYPDWRPRETQQDIPGVRILRGGAFVRYPRVPILRRLVLELWFTAFVFGQMLSRRRKLDLVIAVLPPSLFLLPVRLLVAKTTRLVAIVHDLQGVYAQNRSSRFGALLAKLICAVESRALAGCERIVFLSEAMVKSAVNYKLDASKVVIGLPFVSLAGHGATMDAKTRAYIDAQFPRQDGAQHIVYCGALGEKQNPSGIKALALACVNAMAEVHFHIYSQGALFQELDNCIELQQHARVHLGPFVDEQHLAWVYRAADLNLIPQASGTSDGSLPSKLPNILASGGRVFAICDPNSELLRLLAQFRAGVCGTTWDIGELVQMIKTDLHEQGASAPLPDSFEFDAAVCANFSASATVEKILR